MPPGLGGGLLGASARACHLASATIAARSKGRLGGLKGRAFDAVAMIGTSGHRPSFIDLDLFLFFLSCDLDLFLLLFFFLFSSSLSLLWGLSWLRDLLRSMGLLLSGRLFLGATWARC